MKSYYISHYDVGLIHDFSQTDREVKAEDINNLRRNLIAKYVSKSPISSKPLVYDGVIRIEDAKSYKLIGYLVFNERENGRAYWTKSVRDTFYYPVSAKTGRISGEGMDYFRKPSKRRN